MYNFVTWVWKGRKERKEKDGNSSGTEETKEYLHGDILELSAPQSKLRELVQLPEGLVWNEWLASQVIAFFDHINLIYGTISEFCTMSGCPDMNGPGNREYLWMDEKGKRCKLPSPQYIDYVMTYTQKTVNDESIFPTKFDKEFPSSFELVAKKILRLLFHVLAHIYAAHFKEMVLLNLHTHVNCIFAHLVLFNDRYKLVEEKEVDVLQDLAIALGLFPPPPQDPHPPVLTPSTPDPSNLHFSHPPISTAATTSSVITTQCRSISPFINNNNNGDRGGERASRDGLVEKRTKSELNSQSCLLNSQVPLNDSHLRPSFFSPNFIYGKLREYPLSKFFNRRCTSASAVLLSYASEPSINSSPNTRRSNSSGASSEEGIFRKKEDAGDGTPANVLDNVGRLPVLSSQMINQQLAVGHLEEEGNQSSLFSLETSIKFLSLDSADI